MTRPGIPIQAWAELAAYEAETIVTMEAARAARRQTIRRRLHWFTPWPQAAIDPRPFNRENP